VRGAIDRAATSGTNLVKLEGRIGGRWMKTGRYTLVASATDRAGNATARAGRAPFTVVP
jgi:hypothetical protein